VGDYHGFERVAWLKPAPLIGGDMASREPWRNALARLDQAGLSDWADQRFADKPLALARQAAAKGLNAPMSSSVGRLFDAVAAILGICPDGQSYEGEAAMRLEALARSSRGSRRYDLCLKIPIKTMVLGPIDLSDMIRTMVSGVQAGEAIEDLAFAFHLWLVRSFEGPGTAAMAQNKVETVALAGGCFQNALLTELMQCALSDWPVLVHRRTPANDGGLALGQALIAAATQLKAD
jgi:hydrogenase maturation protein HypF